MPGFGTIAQVDIYHDPKYHRWLVVFFSGKNFLEEHTFDTELEDAYFNSRFGGSIIIKRHYKYSGK